MRTIAAALLLTVLGLFTPSEPIFAADPLDTHAPAEAVLLECADAERVSIPLGAPTCDASGCFYEFDPAGKISGRYKTITNVPAGTGNSDAIDVTDLTDLVVEVTGTFVATLKIQVTIDETNYAQSGSDVTAPGITAVTGMFKKLRINVSAYTSGTPLAFVSGRLNH